MLTATILIIADIYAVASTFCFLVQAPLHMVVDVWYNILHGNLVKTETEFIKTVCLMKCLSIMFVDNRVIPLYSYLDSELKIPLGQRNCLNFRTFSNEMTCIDRFFLRR
jgi:hypothetical protein